MAKIAGLRAAAIPAAAVSVKLPKEQTQLTPIVIFIY